MKKRISVLLAIIMLCGLYITPVSAYTTIDYSCYEGKWDWDQGGSWIEINSCTDTTMSFNFVYGQFAVTVTNAQVDGTNVYGEYYEVWDDGVNWFNYVISGNFHMSLGDSGIWVDWTFSENGSAPSTRGMMFNKFNFQFRSHTIEENNITVTMNEVPIVFDQSPIMYDNRVIVPVRAIFESLDYNVDWDESKQQVTAKNNDSVLKLWIGNKELYHNDKLITSDVGPMLFNDRTLVPVRIISQCAGYDVAWDENTNTVNISQYKNTDDYSKYIGVWQYYLSPNATTPQVELIVNDILNGVVQYELFFYRLAGYEKQTASINKDGTVNFTTVNNEHSSAPISGTMQFENNRVTLTITSSEFMYIEPQTIEFYIKSFDSILN